LNRASLDPKRVCIHVRISSVVGISCEVFILRFLSSREVSQRKSQRRPSRFWIVSVDSVHWTDSFLSDFLLSSGCPLTSTVYHVAARSASP
jgi:hypothetical protein